HCYADQVKENLISDHRLRYTLLSSLTIKIKGFSKQRARSGDACVSASQAQCHKNEIKFQKKEKRNIVPTQSRNSAPAKEGKEKDGSADEVTALARGLTVLRRIAAADAPVSNRELTELTGIPKPTVSRITATLVSAGFLFRLPD